MERVRRLLPVALAMTGAAAVAYGGYGAGVSRAAGAGWPQWLQVAGLLALEMFLLVAALLQTRRGGISSSSFAAEIATLERLVPTVRRHPDGVAALQDLIEVIFEAHIKADPTGSPETLAERRRQGGREHV